jgi:uncharacterized protein YydD (DUF2326 family)
LKLQEPTKKVISEYRDKIRNLTGKKPLQERLEAPAGVDFFMYSSQKLNIYDLQKEQIRNKVANDKKNFYSYSTDFMTLSFPVVDED